MKLIHKSYKFRIYPNDEQKVLLDKHFGSCRFVFNHYLNIRKNSYIENKKSLNYYDNANDLTKLKKDEQFIWLNEINSQSLQSTLRNLDAAYNRFFRKQNKFPVFKSKYDKQSFKVPQFTKIKDNKIHFPKFNDGIIINIHRKIEGMILFCNISKSITDKYYASITCEVEYKSLEKTGSHVGIDTGIKSIAVLSDGTVYENIKVLKSKLKKLKYEQRQLSKKQKGSSSRNKQKKKIAVIHEKITNTRMDYLHKISTDIVKNHDIISVENLAVKDIMNNHNLAQSMSDVGLGILYSMLEYKSGWNDRSYVKIDRYFPSSKMCSYCGWVNQNLALNDREWFCIKCGTHHNRDHNAAINIDVQGLNLLSGCGMQSDIKQKQVEASSSDESMKLDNTNFLIHL